MNTKLKKITGHISNFTGQHDFQGEEREKKDGKKRPLELNHHASTDTSQTIREISMARLSKMLFDMIQKLQYKFGS